MVHEHERDGIGRTLLTVLWALVPALTLGVGTPIVMIHAAARMRDWRQSAAAAFYLLITVMLLTLDRDMSTASRYLYNSGLILNIVGGTGHAFAIRPRVWSRTRASTAIRPRTLQTRQSEALAAHADQQAARGNARAIAENDPQQAIELRIGRPDLANRSFPDGGLIDANNVPAHVLVSAFEMSDAEAESVVRTRAAVGGFSSVADMSVTMNLPPRRLDAAASRLVFLPLRRQ